MAVLAGPAFAQRGSFSADYLDPLLAGSCPDGVAAADAENIAIEAARVPLQSLNPGRRDIGELAFVEGFHITSSDKRFGGLSGVDLLDDGNLLAISDQGDFVWIDLGPDGLTPKHARIAGMKDAEGNALRGKADGDAEGVALVDGVALVSFERNHRVLAFDVGKCGAQARGMPVSRNGLGDFTAALTREALTVGGNEGAEALAVTPDWYMFAGIEALAANASALSARAIEARPEFDLRIGEGAPGMVGIDVLPDEKDEERLIAYSLHRSTNPLATNVIVLVETEFHRELDQAHLPANRISEIESRSHIRFRPVASRVLAGMNMFVTIDNFEGVAARRMPDGAVRLYVIADNNFSASQRTLLMIYDVKRRG